MNKFLKTVAVFAALAMALACFVGCSNNSKDENSDGGDDSGNDSKYKVTQEDLDKYDSMIKGPMVDVTSLDDLLGVWIGRIKPRMEYDDQEVLDRNGKYIVELDQEMEFRITKSGDNYSISESVYIAPGKKGAWSAVTFIFSTPLTDGEYAELKTEFEKEYSGNAEYYITKEKCFWAYFEEIDKNDNYWSTYPLRFKDGLCKWDDNDGDKLWIKKINQAKNGILVDLEGMELKLIKQ